MTLSQTSRLIAHALDAVVFLAAVQLSAQNTTTPAHTVDAWSYTVRTQTQTSILGITGASHSSVISTATGSRKSFDMQTLSMNIPGQAAFHPYGQILITTQSGKDTVVTLLDTVQHTYRQFSNSFAATVFAHTGHSVHTDTAMHATDIAITMDSIGIGPIIQGHQTVHYRQVTRATMRHEIVPGQVMTIQTVDSADYDIAPDLTDSALTINHLLLDVSRVLPGADSLSHAMRLKFPRGFPLHVEARQRMVSTLPSGGTQTMTVSSSMDVDNISHGPVDAALLMTPPSYVLVSDSATP